MTAANDNRPLRLLKLAEVQQRTSLGRSTIYRMLDKGTFPQPMQVSGSMVRWREQDVEGWIEALTPVARAS